MRLIDADELRKAVEDLPNCPNGYSDTYDKACIIGLIDEMPTFEAVSTTEWLKMCIARQEQIKTLLNNWGER